MDFGIHRHPEQSSDDVSDSKFTVHMISGTLIYMQILIH